MSVILTVRIPDELAAKVDAKGTRTEVTVAALRAYLEEPCLSTSKNGSSTSERDMPGKSATVATSPPVPSAASPVVRAPTISAANVAELTGTTVLTIPSTHDSTPPVVLPACPKCGDPTLPREECPRCGIVWVPRLKSLTRTYKQPKHS